MSPRLVQLEDPSLSSSSSAGSVSANLDNGKIDGTSDQVPMSPPRVHLEDLGNFRLSSSVEFVSANPDNDQLDGKSDQAIPTSPSHDHQDSPGLGETWLRARDKLSDDEGEPIEKAPIIIKVHSWLDAVVPARPEPELLQPRMMSDAEMQEHARSAELAEMHARIQRNNLFPPPRRARSAQPTAAPDSGRQQQAAPQREAPAVPNWWLDYHHFRSPETNSHSSNQETTAQGGTAEGQEHNGAYDWLEWD